MERGLLIKNSAIIAAILATVIFSQLPYFKGNTSVFDFPLSKKDGGLSGNSLLSSATDWLKNNVYPRVSGEVAKREEALINEANQQKDVVVQNSVGGVKKFIAEKVLETIGVKPQDLIDPSQTQTECKPQ